jgi:hypothetical protein
MFSVEKETLVFKEASSPLQMLDIKINIGNIAKS